MNTTYQGQVAWQSNPLEKAAEGVITAPPPSWPDAASTAVDSPPGGWTVAAIFLALLLREFERKGSGPAGNGTTVNVNQHQDDRRDRD